MIKYNICQKDYQSIQKIDLLPDDCLRIIYDFLTHKDKHMTYYKYYNDILNIRLTCKKFYFGIPFNYTSAKNNLLEECNERICKSWCKDIYNLDEFLFPRNAFSQKKYEILDNINIVANISKIEDVLDSKLKYLPK